MKIGEQKAKYSYFEGSKAPESTVGDLGDLYRDGSGTIWFKGDDGWSHGEDEVTKHPNLPFYLVFTSRGKIPRWVVRSTLRGRKFKAKDTRQAEKRIREEDEEEEVEVEVEMFG